MCGGDRPLPPHEGWRVLGFPISGRGQNDSPLSGKRDDAKRILWPGTMDMDPSRPERQTGQTLPKAPALGWTQEGG